MRQFAPSFLFFSVLFLSTSFAQDRSVEIRKYLDQSSFPVDTDAAAVVLFERTDIGMLLAGDHYYQKTIVHKIIKILKSEALHVANVSVEFEKYTFGDDVYDIKGTTYNLIDGKVVETPLPKDDNYKGKIVKDLNQVKFAMPEVREGSIIDYSYTINSPIYLMMPPWRVQEHYPKLVSEYSLTYPTKFEFTSILHVRPQLKTFSTEQDAHTTPWPFAQYLSRNMADRTYMFFARKNVPGKPTESFIWNVNNYLERVDFQLTRNSDNNEGFLTSWNAYNKQMWKSEMAKNVRAKNRFLDDTVQAITKNEMGELLKAKAIFNYVRSNYHIENVVKRERQFDIKDVFFDRGGTHSGLNALLTAMLINAGLDAYIMAVSSNEEIPASDVFPVYNRLNYMVCAVKIAGEYVLLDACAKYNIFNQLPPHFYNGYSRIISEDGDFINLTTERLHNDDVHAVNITIQPDGTRNVDYTVKMGMIQSASTRKQIGASDHLSTAFFEKFVARLDEGATITSKKVENLENPDTNLVINVAYTSHGELGSSGSFLGSSFVKLVPKNPFKAPVRNLPIEYGRTFTESWYVNYILPAGYTPESTPKPVSLKVGNGDMTYLKAVSYQASSNTLSVQYGLSVNKATFNKQEYPEIKSFYEQVIKDENSVLEIKRK